MVFTEKDLKLFNIAKEVATFSNHPKVKIGAVIVSGNKILSVGVNSQKSHTMQYLYNRFRNISNMGVSMHHFIHAEIDAIIKLRNMFYPYIPEGIKIYVHRLLKNGDLGYCRPCKACLAALKDHKIHHMYYTTEEGYCYECR
jgi:deoxycytidylate deaminase